MKAYIRTDTREFAGVCALPYAPPGCELCDAPPPEGHLFGRGVAKVLSADGWVDVPDYRGQTWHSPSTGAEVVIGELGVVPPEGYVAGAAE